MKIIFCGFGRAGKECLLQVLTYNNSISISNLLVFTHDNKANEEFLLFLEACQIPYEVKSINKCLEAVQKFEPDYLLSVYYRYIIKSPILELVNYQAINLHPSLLPDYRGTFSSVWALLNGEEYTGISFHYVTDEVDGGNILLQTKIRIQKNDTAFSLYHKLVSLFVFHFKEVLDLLIKGDKGKQQNSTSFRYYKRELPYGGIIEAKNYSYEFAQKFVKAMYFPPFPSAKIIIEEQIQEVATLEQLSKYKNYFT